MEDVADGSYLRAGGIWTALYTRSRIARLAAIKDILHRHATRSVYQQSRADVLHLISRKITRKEYLIRQFDTDFTDALHRQITAIEGEINTLLGMVKAFDAMAAFHDNETALLADEWYNTRRLNITLNQLLDAQQECLTVWRDLAFNLHDECLNTQYRRQCQKMI